MTTIRTFTVATNTALLAKIRGQAVRPAQQHRDRRKELDRRACRGNKRWDE